MSTVKFTRDHEWIRVEDDGRAVVGITDYAQDQLGELVYIEPPGLGSEIARGDDCAVVESVKAAGDVKAPATGAVVAVNEALADRPELANESPMGEGWLFRLELADPRELDGLMDEAQYQAYLNDLG